MTMNSNTKWRLAKYLFEKRIIKTLGDTDLYKLTMKAAFHRWYPDHEAEYLFTCRTPGFDFREILPYIEAQIRLTADAEYSLEEKLYIAKMRNPGFSESFLRFLDNQRMNPSDVSTECDDEGALHIRVRGPVVNVTDWEIYLLTIISELRFHYLCGEKGIDEEAVYKDAMNIQRLNIGMLEKSRLNKPQDFRPCFVDFSTRRRISGEHQQNVVALWKGHDNSRFLAGTSNIALGVALNVPVKGTHAHEWDSAHLAITHPLDAKRLAMQRWLDTFGGSAGIFLTDTFTTRHFLTVFDRHFANASAGVRHDSGHWGAWTDLMLDHYRSLGIDPKSKLLFYSDGLTFPLFLEIYESMWEQATVGFGIGTRVSNDCMFPALQIVIKLVSFGGRPVLKLSDDAGKAMCEYKEVRDYMSFIFGR
jgi:nicotinate phosphoribosyltransferase